MAKINVMVVLAGVVDVDLNKEAKLNSIEYIVAVDGGNDYLEENNLKANIIIGDFDSLKREVISENIIKFPVKKDYSDFHLALKYVKENINYNKVYVYGFSSNERIDHLISNISNLDSNITLINNNSKIEYIDRGREYSITNDQYKYYSFFALQSVEGLNLKNFKYELSNYQLKPFDSLCLSNELIDRKKATVSYRSGKLIMICSKKG